jgi:hypothetical protein
VHHQVRSAVDIQIREHHVSLRTHNRREPNVVG